MAERWPYWGETRTWNWRRGLGPAHYKWVEAAGSDYPVETNTTDAAAISTKIPLEGAVEPVLFSVSDPATGNGIGDVTRSLPGSRGVTITAITAEPIESAPITRDLAHRMPWINSEAAGRWRVTIGDIRDRSIFVRHDEKP